MSFSAGCCIYESDTHSLAYGSLKEYYSMYSARYEDIVTLVKAHGEFETDSDDSDGDKLLILI